MTLLEEHQDYFDGWNLRKDRIGEMVYSFSEHGDDPEKYYEATHFKVIA